MGKYDAELNLSVRTSLSLILQRLRAKSRVLELGPANGRLTRYMSEELQCQVDIVEIDEESGKEAAAFANLACLGPVDGDIDAGRWMERLAGNTYDYIVCADVLEHLRNPGKVLGDCLGFLKKGGSLIASVPNIAHNAVIISLLNGYFDYRNLGLLDNTHIHFFTRQSFRNMAMHQGYKVVFETATYADAEETELGVGYHQIDRTVARALKCRQDGTAYQFVFEIKSNADAGEEQETINLEACSRYYCECFPLEVGQQEYSQLKSCRQLVKPTVDGILQIDFDLAGFSPVQKLRIDPLNTNCILRLLNLELVYEDTVRPVGSFAVNGMQSGDFLVFADEDPQLEIGIGAPDGLKRVRGTFEIISFDDGQIAKIAELAGQARGQGHMGKMASSMTRTQLLKLLVKSFIKN